MNILLNWPFIKALAELLERGLRASALLGVHEGAAEIRFSDVLEGVVPRRALDFFKINAFCIAHVENRDLTDRVKEKLTEAVRDGKTLRDFSNELKGLFDAAGVSPLNDFHIKTVFQTNMQQAYQAGRYWAYEETDPELFPYYQYHTAGDEAVRPEHQALDGAIFRRDDPLLNKIWPPNGYNCRCTMTLISRYEAEDKNLEPSSFHDLFDPATGRPFRVAPGFDRNPAKALSIYDWWRRKMGEGWVATPQTYGLPQIPSDPMPQRTETASPKEFQRYIMERTGGSLRNFEGVNIPIHGAALEKLSRPDKQPYLEWIIEATRNPREVWALPAEGIKMRYLKVFGDYETLVVVSLDEQGIADVQFITGMVRERGGRVRKRGYIDAYRKGVLVFLK